MKDERLIFELDYPRNLLGEIFGEEEIIFPEDTAATVEYVLFRLTEREREIIHQRYQSHMTHEEVGKIHGVTRERTRQICEAALRKLRRPSIAQTLKRGISGRLADARQSAAESALTVQLRCAVDEIKRMSQTLSEIVGNEAVAEKLEDVSGGKLDVPLEELDLSVRSYNILRRAGADKLSDIARLEAAGQLKNLKNLGLKSYNEVVACLRKHGYTVKGSDGIEL